MDVLLTKIHVFGEENLYSAVNPYFFRNSEVNRTTSKSSTTNRKKRSSYLENRFLVVRRFFLSYINYHIIIITHK